jgi:hypothetical protein
MFLDDLTSFEVSNTILAGIRRTERKCKNSVREPDHTRETKLTHVHLQMRTAVLVSCAKWLLFQCRARPDSEAPGKAHRFPVTFFTTSHLSNGGCDAPGSLRIRGACVGVPQPNPQSWFRGKDHYVMRTQKLFLSTGQRKAHCARG